MNRFGHPITPVDIFIKGNHASVGQDKIDPIRDRVASYQPYRPEEELRSNNGNTRLNTAFARPDGQAGGEGESDPLGDNPGERPAPEHAFERLVPFTLQVRRAVKEEIQRIAQEENLSASAAGAALLERAVQGKIDMQYGAMLKPVIVTTINGTIRAATDRSANISLQAYYASEQTRILSITTLSLLLGNKTEALPGIVKESQKQAHENLKRRFGDEKEEE